MSAQDNLLPLPLVTDRLPGPPGPELDPVLDAAAECLARHGIARTSMADIAREMGVSRSTVYRQVGSVEQAAWLLAAREAHRFFLDAPRHIGRAQGPRAVTALLKAMVREACRNPVVTKVLSDEADFVGRAVTRDLDRLVTEATVLVMPLVKGVIDAGMVRRQDPEPLAGWLIRMVVALVLMPLEDDLDAAIDAFVLPLLEP